MQEEIEHKTVNFAISTTKLSARTLLRGMQFLLRQYDKHASQGRQSMKRLVRQNRGVTNVEIQKTGIKDFDKYAKRYHIDYCRAERPVLHSTPVYDLLQGTGHRCVECSFQGIFSGSFGQKQTPLCAGKAA